MPPKRSAPQFVGGCPARVDPGPGDPYHELPTAPRALADLREALTTLLRCLEPGLPVRLETTVAIRNFGHGRCRVAQVVLHWDPARSSLGGTELLHYLRVLALACGCELVDLWVVPEVPDLLEPETVNALAARPFVQDRVADTQEVMKSAASRDKAGASA